VTPYHHGDLRAELLRHAARRLEEDGAAGLSLRELARDAGVSHAAPRQHFRDKQALLDALAVSGLERLARELDVSGDGLEQRLTRFAHTYVGFATENPELLALMFARKEQPALRAANEAAFAAPQAMVDRAVADGDIADADADRVAMAILATIHGLAAIVIAGMIGDRSPDAVVAGTVEVLARGLRATPVRARSAAAGGS
jgi:AcrR family transcriptional regulator